MRHSSLKWGFCRILSCVKVCGYFRVNSAKPQLLVHTTGASNRINLIAGGVGGLKVQFSIPTG